MWDLFRVTKVLLRCFVVVPYTFLLWMGQPYRYSRVYNIFEHYLGRFFAFLLVSFLALLTLGLVLFQLHIFIYIAVSLLVISGIFDLVVMGCRALLVHEAIKRRPQGVNALTIWEDKDLWDDDLVDRNRW